MIINQYLSYLNRAGQWGNTLADKTFIDGLLYAGEHFLGMRTRVHPSKDVGDATVLINDVGDAAGKAGAPSTIRCAQNMRCVAEEREAEAKTGSEGFIVFNCVKAGPENLHVALREGLIEGVEPAPFGAASPGVGFGIKP